MPDSDVDLMTLCRNVTIAAHDEFEPMFKRAILAKQEAEQKKFSITAVSTETLCSLATISIVAHGT